MFTFPVEAGHILTFARALDDDEPVCTDPAAARAAGFPAVLAPPTFVEASAHFDPASEVRPLPGRRWFGSAAEPTGDPGREARATGTTFHAETHIEYRRHLVAGDVLTVSERPGSTWEKVGSRGGRLTFRDWCDDYVDQAGQLAVTVRTVAVTTDQKVPPPTPPPPRPEPGRQGGAGLDPAFDVANDAPVGPVDPQQIAEGDQRSLVLVRNLTRTRIVQYAGASGDFSPQHTDEHYNIHAAGYPTVFAHGMLTMGMAARLLTGWFGPATLARYGLRFLGQVWPGDSLVARGAVTAVRRGGPATEAEVAVEVLDQRGTAVVRGSATVHLPRLGPTAAT